jgi:hypothetical protein
MINDTKKGMVNMTRKQIIARIDRILHGRYHIEGEYGEESFPIRMTQRQADAVYAYMKSEGISCLFNKITVNPKAVYRLSVRFYPFKKNGHYMWWGIKCVTEFPTTCR